MPYTIEEHKHRLAAWDAATSARVRTENSFTVEIGVSILEACGFNPGLAKPDQLPIPNDIDIVHRKWREDVIKVAINHGKKFTHGIAAKLINSYLKARFVCGGHHEHENVKHLHPPIDRVLLHELAVKNIGHLRAKWHRLENVGWSKFNSDQYEEVIGLIRKSIPGRPLWEIEQYWQGYQ